MNHHDDQIERYAEFSYFSVGIAGVVAAGYFFFSIDRPMDATLAMAFWLIVGELGGRAVASWIRQQRSN